VKGRAYKTAGLYLFASASALFALCKVAGIIDWSWWRICLPVGAYVGFNLLHIATGFGYLSWIEFVEANGTTEGASIAVEENRGHLKLGAIQFALFALGVTERASPSEALNGFWRSFGSAAVMIAFGSLAIVSLVLYWSTNVERNSDVENSKDSTR
jgi:hypothetical protein